ncbi:MFS transporter, PPP family, 3-phenylpropionic acid transporter [Paenibacillus sp. yr247]|uniref:MFS transporter n=1 Tax=Paenibacillus sp. yr247 TaxID=1761880 RepID=UPI0008877539|nr:MFS transporter [Paenibacillus sp. yr247]SDO26927.1 MFS transporter, PPP family, 3-phenylpropionic acid transporter [Paenibacillus sp. yr247]
MKLDKQIISLSGVNFFYYASSAILLPYLPLYLQVKGYSASEIGLLMMIGPFISIFAQPFWGYVSDRFNSVKNIVFLLWVLSLLGSFGLFLTNGYGLTLGFILLLYFFLLPSVPLIDNLVVKSTAHRGMSYGSVRLWGSIGFSGVALVSGLLLDEFGGVASIPYFYWVLWIFPFLLLAFIKDEKGSGQRITLSAISVIFKNKSFLWFMLMILIISIPHRMNDALLGLYLNKLGASDAMVSWAWAIAACSEIPIFALINRYIHRYHELTILGIASVLYTLRWLLYTFISDPWVLIGLQVTHMFTFAVLWIVAVQYVVRLLPEQFGSTGQSILAMVFMGLAGIIGGAVGGWLSEQWGGASMYVFATVMSAIAAGMFFGTQAVMRGRS